MFTYLRLHLGFLPLCLLAAGSLSGCGLDSLISSEDTSRTHSSLTFEPSQVLSSASELEQDQQNASEPELVATPEPNNVSPEPTDPPPETTNALPEPINAVAEDSSTSSPQDTSSNDSLSVPNQVLPILQEDTASEAQAESSDEPEFVAPPQPRSVSAQITWEIPTQRENGDDLSFSEIGGYKLSYREAGTEKFTQVMINDQNTASYTVSNLSWGGAYEFRVSTFDDEGLFSELSSPLFLTIGS